MRRSWLIGACLIPAAAAAGPPAPHLAVPLPAAPVSGPLAVPGDPPALLLWYGDTLEKREAATGEPVWRIPLGPGGHLQSRAFGEGRCGPAVGWAGVKDGAAEFRSICLADGRIAARTPLPRSPVGAPVPVPSPDRPLRWFVPLEGGTVAEMDAEGGVRAVHVVGTPLVPPLVALLGGVAAWVGDPPRLTPLERHRRRGLPEGADPRTAAVEGDCVVAGAGRAAVAWSCRRRHGRIRCRRLWRQRLGAGLTAPPVIDGGRVLVPSLDTFLYGFARDNGHLLFRSPAEHRLASPGALFDGRIAFTPAATAEILVFDRGDGRRVATIRGERGELFLTPPAPAGDRVFVAVLAFPGEKVELRGYPLPSD